MEDMGILINQALRNANIQTQARVLGGTVVVSEKFISHCQSLFEDAMQQKAQKVQLPVSLSSASWLRGKLLSQRGFWFCASQEVKNNPVFLITEEDLRQASVLTESSGPSKKEKREAERRKKAAGAFAASNGCISCFATSCNLLSPRGQRQC